MTDVQRRARNALLGLATGDAIGWPAMFHRSRTLPPWTRRLRREIDGQREETGVLRVPMPFSLNQPPETFELCATDDTEWAAWTMRNLLRHRCLVEAGWVCDVWVGLAKGGGTVRGGVSTQAALENLRRGVMPPSSGNDNPHYFDDGAACRAVPIGIAYAGRTDDATRAAAIDACVTNSEDGIWVAQSVAAAISSACAGRGVSSAIEAAVGALPPGSWSRRTVLEALKKAGQALPLLALFPSFHAILNPEYSDGCAGPETLALSLAIVSRLGDRFDEAVTAATAFAKSADAVPAIVGAITGALAESKPVPVQWESNIAKLRGICLPELAGQDYIRLVDEFIGACSFNRTNEVPT